jgi:putative toxin-antitoxin system antitoxin component (TIGR02293 family)
MKEELNIMSESEVLYASRAGITRQKVTDLMNLAGFTLAEMGQFMHIAPRTIQRKNSDEKLPSDISERVLLIQNLYHKGGKVFGDINAFKQWMLQPNLALGEVAPKTYLDTFSGIELLMHELGRIEHGLVA